MFGCSSDMNLKQYSDFGSVVHVGKYDLVYSVFQTGFPIACDLVLTTSKAAWLTLHHVVKTEDLSTRISFIIVPTGVTVNCTLKIYCRMLGNNVMSCKAPYRQRKCECKLLRKSCDRVHVDGVRKIKRKICGSRAPGKKSLESVFHSILKIMKRTKLVWELKKGY